MKKISYLPIVFVTVLLMFNVSCETFEPAKKKNNTLVRVTEYDKGDYWSARRMTSTGVRMRPANSKQIGVAAVDPKKITYGSLITLTDKNDRELYYIAADCGGDVTKRRAVKGTVSQELRHKYYSKNSSEYRKKISALVVDVHSLGKKQVGDDWQYANIIRYPGKVPFHKLSRSEQYKFMNMKSWRNYL